MTSSKDNQKNACLINTCTQTAAQVTGSNSAETSRFTVCDTKFASAIRRTLLRFVLSSKQTTRWMLSCSTTLTCSTKATHKNNMHKLRLCYIYTKKEILIACTCLVVAAAWVRNSCSPRFPRESRFK